MYFPYLRGKQFELTALREVSNLIVNNKNVIPIIEPVRSNFAALNKSLEIYKEAEMPLLLITNPIVGELVDDRSELTNLVQSATDEYSNLIPGLIISNNTKINDIDRFIKDYSNTEISFIHIHEFDDIEDFKNLLSTTQNVGYNIFIEGSSGTNYQSEFSHYNRILIRDGFRVQRRNADYPPDEFFSELHLTYKELGYEGFGDFAIVGEHFLDSGGPSYAVAIHMTYIHQKGTIWIRHFLSDRRETMADTPGKFLEALEIFKESYDSGEFQNTDTAGCQNLLTLLEDEYYPGLGTVKKISIRHHIELYSNHI